MLSKRQYELVTGRRQKNDVIAYQIRQSDVYKRQVLAAMTTGDRSYLSSAMRSAYRGAGLAHVLVVSGMHVSILCVDILSTLLPYE